MPQLMPLYWMFSVLFIVFVIILLYKLYSLISVFSFQKSMWKSQLSNNWLW